MRRLCRLAFWLLPLLMLASAVGGVADAIASAGVNGRFVLPVGSWLTLEARQVYWIINWLVLFLLLVLVAIGFWLSRRLREKVARLKAAQQELRDQSELLRLATEANQAGAWDYHPATGEGYLSGQWYATLGYAPQAQKVAWAMFRDFVHPEDQPLLEETFREYIDGGGQGQVDAEFRLRRADGVWCWVLSKGTAVQWDEHGIPSRIIGLTLNNQKIKEAQETMAQSEKKFRAIFENAPYAIVINRLEDGRFLEANKQFLTSRGISREELLQLTDEVWGQTPAEEVADVLDTLVKTGSAHDREAVVVERDGTCRDVKYSSVLLDIQGQKQILSITVDVTEQKRAEAALKQSEERFRTLFRMAPLPMSHISLDGTILAVNDRFRETLGYSIDEVPDLEGAWALLLPDPDFRRRITSQWTADLERSIADKVDMGLLECPVVCKDGSVRTMVLSTNLIENGIIVSYFDITARKRAEEEREKLQGQLLQMQKLEAVGNLAGGIAHDFNNMLGAITGYAELTIAGMGPADPFRKYLYRILDTAQRSANLTRQLLTFARKQTIEPVVFDLNEAVAAILKMIRRLIGENIELVWSPGAGPCTVSMDPSQLDQILVNLCVNARDAIAGFGKVALETDTVSIDAAFCASRAECIPGEYVLLTVSDDGCGMDKETLPHIFEPFFTTKEAGQGTGMGLATVYGIVRQHNGFIGVYSEPGKGTAFRIYIPLNAESTAPGTERVEDIPRSRGETLLIVEDDEALRELIMMMLHHLGYTIISAGTPGEAIRIAEESGADIHLVITDVVLPEMNGRDLAKRLQSIRPGMKSLFMSGYAAHIIEHQGILDQGVDFIQKPFLLKEIAARLRTLLDGSGK